MVKIDKEMYADYMVGIEVKRMKNEQRELKIDIGKRLKEFRENNMLSQEDVADKIGVSISQYQRYERGTSTILPDKLVSLYYLLNLDLKYLYIGEYSLEKTGMDDLYQKYMVMNWNDKLGFYERLNTYVINTVKNIPTSNK